MAPVKASANERSFLSSFGSKIREDPVRAEITQMITCIKAADCLTVEHTADEAGYSGEKSSRGENPVTIHVIEYVLVKQPVFMGLITKEIQQSKPICIIRFEGSIWKIKEEDIFNTEKLSVLYRHLKYYGLKIQLEGTSEEILNGIYIEARKARPGAIDRPLPDGEKI